MGSRPWRRSLCQLLLREQPRSQLDAEPLTPPNPATHPQICQSNYTADLLQWVDADNLPVWLGGRSKGTLLDDVGPWSDPEVLHRLEPDLPAAGRALKVLRVSLGSGMGGGGGAITEEGEDGYASPRSEASFVSALSTCSSLAEALSSAPSLLRASAGDKKPPLLQQHLSYQRVSGAAAEAHLPAERTSSDHEALIAAVNAARWGGAVVRVGGG